MAANQPRKPGVRRIPTGASLHRKIRQAVNAEARHFRVSRSFVVAVALAEALGVALDADETYKPTRPALRLVAGRRRG